MSRYTKWFSNKGSYHKKPILRLYYKNVEGYEKTSAEVCSGTFILSCLRKEEHLGTQGNKKMWPCLNWKKYRIPCEVVCETIWIEENKPYCTLTFLLDTLTHKTVATARTGHKKSYHWWLVAWTEQHHCCHIWQDKVVCFQSGVNSVEDGCQSGEIKHNPKFHISSLTNFPFYHSPLLRQWWVFLKRAGLSLHLGTSLAKAIHCQKQENLQIRELGFCFLPKC